MLQFARKDVSCVLVSLAMVYHVYYGFKQSDCIVIYCAGAEFSDRFDVGCA